MARRTTPLTDEQRDRAGDPNSVRMARAVARSAARRCPGLALEIESECMWTLCRAAVTYEPGRLPWLSYLYHRLRYAALHAQRREHPKGFRCGNVTLARGQHVPTREPLAGLNDGDDEAPLAAADLPVGWELESEDEVRALTRGLSTIEREAVTRYYLNAGTTGEKLSARLGISPPWLVVVLRSAYQEIRRRRPA